MVIPEGEDIGYIVRSGCMEGFGLFPIVVWQCLHVFEQGILRVWHVKPQIGFRNFGRLCHNFTIPDHSLKS